MTASRSARLGSSATTARPCRRRHRAAGCGASHVRTVFAKSGAKWHLATWRYLAYPDVVQSSGSSDGRAPKAAHDEKRMNRDSRVFDLIREKIETFSISNVGSEKSMWRFSKGQPTCLHAS